MHIRWMEILRPGIWNDWEFSADYIREMQASYDPAIIEAPIVVGHPNSFFGDEQPAHGWVKQLKIRVVEGADDPDYDISLWAKVELTDDGLKYIEDRSYPKRSVGINEENPYKGIPYLKHVALLGASNPAVSDMTDELITVEKAEALGFRDLEGNLIMLSVQGGKNLVWESKQKEYWFRVKDPAKFRDDSLRSFSFKGIKGIRSIGGKLKINEGKDSDPMVVQALRFNKKYFDLSRAKAWVKDHKGELSQMSTDDLTLEASDRENKKLQEKLATLEIEQERLTKSLDEEKALREKKEAELEGIRLTRQTAEFNVKFRELEEKGKAVPAFREMGVPLALTAIDGITVEVGGKEQLASEIILSAFEAIPEIVARREIAGASQNAEETTETAAITHQVKGFVDGMNTLKSEGKKVINEDLAALAEQFMSKDSKLSAKDAFKKAAMQLGGTK